MRISVLVGMVLLGAIAPSAQACSNLPFWQNTLRCKFFPNADQTPPPAPDEPLLAADIKDFTLVPLPSRNESGEALRCIDGTRPAIYVDEAENTNNKDNWVITLQGGGSCNDADSCLAAYLNPSETSEMGTATNRASKNMEGIHRSANGNAFSKFNRVRIQKCSYDRYNGTTTQRNVSASVDSDVNENGIQAELIKYPPMTVLRDQQTILEGERVTADLFHHGHKIVLHALDQLRDGLSYRTWEDDGSGNAASIQKTMVALADAESVLFVGHSGGANGLMNSIDGLSDTLSTWTRNVDNAPFSGSVRALFDAHLLPSIESEAAFNEHLPGDVFAHRTLCKAPCESGVPLHYTYDGMRYFGNGGEGTDGHYDGPAAQWDVPLDQSCLADHSVDAWRCADRFHVLFNHIGTAFFIREDFRDPNGQHNNNPVGPENHGHRLFWADSQPEFCENSDGASQCPPALSAADFRARVEEQAKRFVSGFDSRSELALSGASIPTVYIWLPDCAAHEGAFDDHQFANILLDSQSLGQQTNMHDFVVDFVNDATTGIINRRIDGEGDLRSLCQ